MHVEYSCISVPVADTIHVAPPDAGSAGGGGSSGIGSTVDSESSSGTNTGAIAGGVVGGVVAIAAIAALVWFLRRRKKHDNQGPAEMDGMNHAGEVPSHTSDVKYTYTGHGPVHEAGGDEYRQEMDTPNPPPSSVVKSALGDYRQELATDPNHGVAPVELYGGEVPSGRRG